VFSLKVLPQTVVYCRVVTKNTRSGSIVFNDTGIQAIVPGLSFGGSGNSGCISLFLMPFQHVKLS